MRKQVRWCNNASTNFFHAIGAYGLPLTRISLRRQPLKITLRWRTICLIQSYVVSSCDSVVHWTALMQTERFALVGILWRVPLGRRPPVVTLPYNNRHLHARVRCSDTDHPRGALELHTTHDWLGLRRGGAFKGKAEAALWRPGQPTLLLERCVRDTCRHHVHDRVRQRADPSGHIWCWWHMDIDEKAWRCGARGLCAQPLHCRLPAQLRHADVRVRQTAGNVSYLRCTDIAAIARSSGAQCFVSVVKDTLNRIAV